MINYSPRLTSALRRLDGIIVLDDYRATACCPAHPDSRPSLSITEIEDRILLHCFAGCRIEDIVRALGLRMSDLFFSNRSRRIDPAIIQRRIAMEYLNRWHESEIRQVAEGLRERDRLIRLVEWGLAHKRLTQVKASNEFMRAYFKYSELEYKFQRLLTENALVLWRCYGKTPR
jgi:hypothetical protein